MSLPQKFNGRETKLTREVHQLFVNTLKLTGRITIAARKCAVHTATVHRWLAKGRTQKPGRPYRNFLDAVERAHADFLAVAAARHHQLAIGGVIQLPVMDKANNPVRDADGNLIYIEKVVMPSERALQFELDRLDPVVAEIEPEMPDKTKAELEAEALQYVDLFSGGIKILLDLGVPLPQIVGVPQLEPPTVEVETAAVVPETTAATAPHPVTACAAAVGAQTRAGQASVG
jgi:hypothetical protein